MELAPGSIFNSRIRIPLTEYQIVCDRLTDAQLCAIMRDKRGRNRAWRDREGTVNSDVHGSAHGLFMNEDEGTLLFDTWTLDQTFAPDVDNPRRWRLSCVLKCREINDVLGPYPDDPRANKYPIGWNHDYKRDQEGKLGWKFITMAMSGGSTESGWTPHGDCREGYVPRYPFATFWDLFCDAGRQQCDESQPPSCGNLRAEKRERAIAEIIAEARGVSQRRSLNRRS
jgi:hypothetical protein